MARLVFDFDGTLADSLSVALEVANSIKVTRPLTLDDYYRLRHLPTRLILKDLQIPLWRVPQLISRGRKLLKQQGHRIEPHKGMPELIRQLVADGHELYVVSSNSPELVNQFIERTGINDCFNQVIGNISIFGKAAALKKLSLTFDEVQPVYYVGDETRDIEAAKKAQVYMIAVAWGYNSPEVLSQRNPDFVVTSPAEIRKAVKDT